MGRLPNDLQTENIYHIRGLNLNKQPIRQHDDDVIMILSSHKRMKMVIVLKNNRSIYE